MPGWIVASRPSTTHPDRSTDSVADGLWSSTYSASPAPAGRYMISLITTAGAEDCDGGTGLPGPVLSAMTVRRSARPSRKLVREALGV